MNSIETRRYALVFLHLFLSIFAVVNLHPHFSLVAIGANREKRLSAIVACVNDVVRFCLFHGTCVAVVWFAKQNNATLLRLSGLFLIGEFIQNLGAILRDVFLIDQIESMEILYHLIYFSLLFVSMLMTFGFAETMEKRREQSMYLELRIRERSEENVEPVAL